MFQSLAGTLSSLVPDQCNYHAVEIEKEHEEVEAELDEGLFLVDVEFAEDLGGVEEVLILEDLLSIPSH